MDNKPDSIGTLARKDYDERKEREREEQQKHDAIKKVESEKSKSGFTREVESFQQGAEQKAEGKTIAELNAIAEQDMMQGVENSQKEQALRQGDELQRSVMQDNAKLGDEKASEWLKQDEMANRAKLNEENIQNEIEKRSNPNYLKEAEEGKETAQKGLIDHIEAQPKPWERGKLKEWKAEGEKVNAQLENADKRFFERAEKADPKTMEGLYERLEQRHTEAQEAIEKRQAIAEMPSEVEEKQGKVNINEHIKQLSSEMKPSEITKERDQVAKADERTGERVMTEKKTKVQVQ